MKMARSVRIVAAVLLGTAFVLGCGSRKPRLVEKPQPPEVPDAAAGPAVDRTDAAATALAFLRAGKDKQFARVQPLTSGSERSFFRHLPEPWNTDPASGGWGDAWQQDLFGKWDGSVGLARYARVGADDLALVPTSQELTSELTVVVLDRQDTSWAVCDLLRLQREYYDAASPAPAATAGDPAETRRKLQLALGDAAGGDPPFLCELASQGLILAADELTVEADGRARLTHFRAAVFRPGVKPEAVFTAQAGTARLTLDGRITGPAELAGRKVVSVELDEGVTFTDTRRTGRKEDDLIVSVPQGTALYSPGEGKLRTEAAVSVQDNRARAARFLGRGLELDLATPPSGPCGVTRLVLKADAELRGATGARPRLGELNAAAEPCDLTFRTPGPCTFDFRDGCASFDGGAKPGNVQAVWGKDAPTQVVCDHLDVQFRREGKAVSASPGEVESLHARAAGDGVTLVTDADRLSLTNVGDLLYRSSGDGCPRLTARGEAVLVRLGEKEFTAPEIDLAAGATFRGPGRLRLPGGSNAAWKDTLVFAREGEGERLTLTGGANLSSEAEDYRGRRLDVTLGRQGLRKVAVLEQAEVLIPGLKVTGADSLVVSFEGEAAAGEGAKQAPERQAPALELSARQAEVSLQGGGKHELRRLSAEGKPTLRRAGTDPGLELRGEALSLERRPGGDVLTVLGSKEEAARYAVGKLLLLGPRVVVDEEARTATVEGAGGLTVPGSLAAVAAREGEAGSLEVLWEKGMQWAGKVAEFHAGVTATQGDVRLRGDALTLTLAGETPFARWAAPERVEVEQLVADGKACLRRDVRDKDRVLSREQLEGASLAADAREGKVTVAGPGRLTLFRAGDKVGTLTRVSFGGRGFSSAKPGRLVVKCLENVEAVHLTAAGPDAAVPEGDLPAGAVRVTAESLTLDLAAPDDGPVRLRLTADRNVSVTTDSLAGRADRIAFDTLEDRVLLEGSEESRAVVRQARPGNPPREIKGTRLLYDRRAGTFVAGNADVSPTPTPAGPAAPKP